ncbi:hypothetical protein TY91_07245 [Secundilactobacillus collinoides]|uniref:Uncharacterized protein n=1 Tax=Secundilactobacillus collinoides TaxID=33960 RepID=A0A161XU81_SECCO|nr:hypothetical protein TY91_07245 [Secundilactobacillus collinoides]
MVFLRLDETLQQFYPDLTSFKLVWAATMPLELFPTKAPSSSRTPVLEPNWAAEGQKVAHKSTLTLFRTMFLLFLFSKAPSSSRTPVLEPNRAAEGQKVAHKSTLP